MRVRSMNIDDRRPTSDRPQGPFPHLGKFQNGHNSATRYPIHPTHSMYAHRPYFVLGQEIGHLFRNIKRKNETADLEKQAGRRLVRSLLTICDIGVSLHPWPMWITELRITRYSAAYAKFERRTKLVISKLQCNTTLIESG